MPRKKGTPYKRNTQPAKAPKTVNNFIRQHREAADLTLEDLAAASGVSLSSISAYERGEIDPSIKYLHKLSKALGVPRGMLLDVDPTLDPPLWASVLRATAVTPDGTKK